MKLIEYVDDEMLAIDLANHLAGELRATLNHEDRALFVVPGWTRPAQRKAPDLRCAGRVQPGASF